MKIAFFGTGEFSKNILAGIYNDLEVALIVSQPDKLVGRKQELIETPIKVFAKENGLKVLQPTKLKENFEFFAELKALNLDFIVVVAYGKIIPKEVLEIPRFGCINIHGSILPAYRGASPVQESLKNGDKKTGLTIMKMTEGMDEGDILQIQEIQIDEQDKTPDIFRKFEEIGPNLLVKTLKGIINGNITGIPQDNSKATYCRKIEKIDGKIDFKNETAEQIYNKFRAYYIWPGIYSFYKGKKFDIVEAEMISDKGLVLNNRETGKVLEIKNSTLDSQFSVLIGVICKEGVIILKKVKIEGKKELKIKDVINGDRKFVHYRF